MSRRPHKPTPEGRKPVELHATVGTPQEIIADILGIDSKTLRKHYRAELDQSLAKANAVVGGKLFNKAKGGDTTAAIFWMKTRAGWKETSAVELGGPGGGPIQHISTDMTPQEAAEAYAATLHGHKG